MIPALWIGARYTFVCAVQRIAGRSRKLVRFADWISAEAD
jgi:hypothetical protein